MIVTHLGTATVLIEVAGLRLLTDPALDPAGRRYRFRAGLASTKTESPALPAGGLPPIDLVLLSHDHHADNLDDAGRALLPTARRVLTTPAGARRLGGNALGLATWQTHDEGALRITAVPARHGPRGIELVDSVTTGFVLEWPGQQRGALWISGDTVYFAGLRELARRFRIGTAIVHLGAARFPLTGPVHFTFTAAEAVRIADELGRPVIVPVHYAGWTHFAQDRDAFDRAAAARGLDVRWLSRGEPVAVET